MVNFMDERAAGPYGDAAAAIGRALLAAIFIIAGAGKLMAPAATKAYIASAGLPLPEIAYWGAVILELGGGLCVLLGLGARYAAPALALFSVVAGVIFHHDFSDQTQWLMFLKDLAIAGGLLQIFAHGSGAFSLDERLGLDG